MLSITVTTTNGVIFTTQAATLAQALNYSHFIAQAQLSLISSEPGEEQDAYDATTYTYTLENEDAEVNVTITHNASIDELQSAVKAHVASVYDSHVQSVLMCSTDEQAVTLAQEIITLHS